MDVTDAHTARLAYRSTGHSSAKYHRILDPPKGIPFSEIAWSSFALSALDWTLGRAMAPNRSEF